MFGEDPRKPECDVSFFIVLVIDEEVNAFYDEDHLIIVHLLTVLQLLLQLITAMS